MFFYIEIFAGQPGLLTGPQNTDQPILFSKTNSPDFDPYNRHTGSYSTGFA